MKLTVLGCSGSVPVPDNPASGYLLSFPSAPSIALDLGPGTLAALQKIQDPTNAHVLFTHLHADHCSDFPSLLVWRRFHPEAPAASRNFCLGPTATPVRLGRLSADSVEEVDDMSDTFAFTAWQDREAQHVDDVVVTPFKVEHPIEAFALRVEHRKSGAIVTYSGDTAYTPALIEAARDADLFLCEAAWGVDTTDKPAGMHMSGAEAGKAARIAGVGKLVLVHLQPWGDAEATLAAARAEFDGPVELAFAGQEFEL